jgi:membrane protein implicated in regulation of membrane protease activity
MPRYGAFLVGIVAAAAFVALYQLVAWWAAYVLLALWLAATILYRRRQRRRDL